MDEGSYCYSIHGHREWIALSCAFLGVECGPSIKSWGFSRYVLVMIFESDGHRCSMLRRAASRFSELNAFEASTRITASVPWD